MARVAIFIDGGYLKKVLTEISKPTICFRKLSDVLARSDERVRTYYYYCPPFLSQPPTSEEKERQAKFDRFIKRLQETVTRFEFRKGRLAKYQTIAGPKFEQKKVDILLAVDLLRLSFSHQIQRAVLVAGDSDFVPAITVARDEGVIVELCYSAFSRPHDELLRVCDEKRLIDDTLIQSVLQDRSS
jgi:uncharacterized LabA/DUF88 family protein